MNIEELKAWRESEVARHDRWRGAIDTFIEVMEEERVPVTPKERKIFEMTLPKGAPMGKSLKPAKETRECDWCRELFEPRRCDQRFCSKECSKKLHNAHQGKGKAEAAPRPYQRKAVELKDMPKRVVSKTAVVKLGGTRAEFDEALRRTIQDGPGAFTVVEIVQACSAQFPALQSKCTVENVRYKLKRMVDDGELIITGGGSSPRDPTRFARGKKWMGPGTVTKVEETGRPLTSRVPKIGEQVSREYEVFRKGVHVPRDPEVEGD